MEKLILILMLNDASGTYEINKMPMASQYECIMESSAIISDPTNVVVSEDEIDYIYDRTSFCATIEEAKNIVILRK